MKVTSCAIADVLLIEPRVFGDERGFFFESFNQRAFNLATGLAPSFVQDNHSKSARGVLRGPLRRPARARAPALHRAARSRAPR